MEPQENKSQVNSSDSESDDGFFGSLNTDELFALENVESNFSEIQKRKD